MLVRAIYRQGIAMHNDFLGTVGAYNFQFLSARPKQIQNYLMLLWPFDRYIWAFLLASVVAVTITLAIIDTMYANWTNASTRDIIYQSRYDISNLDISIISLFSGIIIGIASIIEAETRDYFNKEKCSKARELLLLQWAMIGFLLTTCYKETLLSTLINIEYEKTIDSVDDVLKSEKLVMYDGTTGIANLLKSDPRKNVKELGKLSKPYATEIAGAPPTWVIQGYIVL